MKRKLLLIVSLLLLAAMLFGCAAESAKGNDTAMDNGYVADGEMGATGDLTGTSGTTATPQDGQKLVRKVWLNAETEDMDGLLAAVEEKITELSGYVEAREVYNGSQYSGRRYRNAELTVRIPVENMDGFISHVTENANITSTTETVENITLTYIATQSRITALETEQTRLLELLAQAENMDDLLQIEKRLTEVRTELEEVTSQLRMYDNMVSYSTIYLTVNEVTEYTVVEEPETVWQRIGTGFVRSLKGVGNFFTELFVFVIVASPWLAIPALWLGIIILLIRLLSRKKKKKKEKA